MLSVNKVKSMSITCVKANRFWLMNFFSSVITYIIQHVCWLWSLPIKGHRVLFAFIKAANNWDVVRVGVGLSNNIFRPRCKVNMMIGVWCIHFVQDGQWRTLRQAHTEPARLSGAITTCHGKKKFAFCQQLTTASHHMQGLIQTEKTTCFCCWVYGSFLVASSQQDTVTFQAQ